MRAPALPLLRVLLLRTVCPSIARYHWPPGTFEPPVSPEAHGCTELNAALAASKLNEAVDLCFDPAGSCDESVPYTGYATVCA